MHHTPQAPTADQVRAEGVLVKSLENVMMKWKRDQNYAFVCEQLKSIRQDLTVSLPTLETELCQ